MQRILLDTKANERLASDGYIVFPLLDEAAVRAATRLYRTHFPQDPPGLLTSMRAPVETRVELASAAKSLLGGTVAGELDQATVLGGVFFAKGFVHATVVPAHRDFCLVDETRYRSFNLWVPLVDVDVSNGCIQILPQSHRILRDIRGPNFPESIEKIKDLLWERMLPLPMKAGQALLYDHSLIHGSWANLSGTLRPAAVVSIVPKDAGVTLHWKRDSGLAVLPCDEAFLLTGELKTAGDVLTAREIIEYDFPAYDEKDFRAAFRSDLGRT